jgi:nucleoside-diphosphate-sugar epimerase
VIGPDAEAVHEPPRSGDIRHSRADISRTREVLAWTPAVNFTEGLERTIEWYRESSKS